MTAGPAIQGAAVVDRSVVPAGLDFDPATDPARRRHLVLAMPWGARVNPLHTGDEWAGRVLRRGDVQVDQALARSARVNLNHNPRVQLGQIVDAVEDERGVWAVVDLTEHGERVFAAGNGDVSAEIIQPGDSWLLAGVALLSADETPAIPGSRVVFTRDGREHRVFGVAAPSLAGLGLVESMGKLADWTGGGSYVVGPRQLDPAANPQLSGYALPTRVATDVTAHKQELRGMSMRAVEEQVERERALYADRLASLAEEEAGREESELLGRGVPMQFWPKHTRGYRSWLAMETRARHEVLTVHVDQMVSAIDEVIAVPEREVKLPWTTRMRLRWRARSPRTARGARSRPELSTR